MAYIPSRYPWMPYVERNLLAGTYGWRPPDYIPSYWENPYRVARYYHVIQSLPPGVQTPPWLDRDQVTSAYEYLKFANNDKPWDQWQYLHPDDPGRTLLQGIPQPPDEALWPAERYEAGGLVNRARGIMGIQAGGLPSGPQMPEQRSWVEQQLYGTPGQPYAPREITEIGQPSQAGMTDEQFAALQPWQRKFYEITGSPITSAGMGALGGMAAGRMFGPAGIAIGGVVGGGLGYGASKSPTLASILNVFDQGAEAVERFIGTLEQIGGSIIKPEQYGDFESVIRNMGHVWQAGRYTYNVGAFKTGEDLGNIFSGGGLPGPSTMQMPEEMKRKLGVPIPTLAGPGQVWGWESGKPVTPELGTGLAAVVAIRNLIDQGASVAELDQYITQMYGMSGVMNDLALHMVLDPLNFTGEITRGAAKVGGRGKAFGIRFAPENADLIKAAEMGHGIPETLQAYRTLTRLSVVADQDKLSQLGRMTKFIAGLTQDGRDKMLLDTGGVFNYLTHLTPRARVQEVMDGSSILLGELMSRADDPYTFAKYLHSLANTPEELAAKLSMVAANSPDASMLRMVAKELAPMVDESLAKFEMTRWQSDMIDNIARVTGQKPEDVLRAIGKAPDADILLKQYIETARASGAAEAADIVKAFDRKELTGDTLRNILKIFTGDDPLPRTMGEWMGQTYAGILDKTSEFSAKYFNVEPDPGWLRFGNALKKAQNFVYLKYNPNYVIVNTVNDFFTMAATGMYGYRPKAAVAAVWDRLGYKPPRLSAGFGIAGAAMADVDLAKEAGKMGKLGAVDILKRANFSTLAERVEEYFSRQAVTDSFLHTRNRLARQGVGYSYMPSELAQALEETMPGLSKRIVQDVLSSWTQKEVEGKVFQGQGRNYEYAVQPAAEQLRNAGLKVTDAEVWDTLNRLGLEDVLKQLEQNAPAEVVHKTFRKVFRDFDDWVAEQSRISAKARATHVAAQIKTEGFTGVQRLIDEESLEFMETYAKSKVDWGSTIAKARENPDQASSLIAAERAHQRMEFDRIGRNEAANTLGIFEGLGADSASAREAQLTRIAQLDNRRNFFITKEKLQDEFFGLPKKERTPERWDALLDDIDNEYFKSSVEDVRLQMKMNDILVGVFERQHPEQAPAARAWRDAQLLIQQEIQSRFTRFHQTLRGMTAPERDVAWSKFWNEDGLPLYRQFKQGEIDGIHGIAGTPGAAPVVPEMRVPEVQGVPEPAPAVAQAPPVVPPAPVPEVAPSARQAVLDAAHQHFIPTITAKTYRPNDRYLLNIIRKYGGEEAAAYKVLDDVDPAVAERAFAARDAARITEAPAIKADEVADLEARKAEAAAQVLDERDILSSVDARATLYDYFLRTAGDEEKADAWVQIVDAHAQDWAKRNNKTVADWYEKWIGEWKEGKPTGDALFQENISIQELLNYGSMRYSGVPEKQIQHYINDLKRDGKKYLDVFYGTKPKLVDLIRKSGIQKGETWYDRPPSVYFIVDKGDLPDSMNFLAMNFEGAEGDVAIIKFRIPIEHLLELKEDHLFNSTFNVNTAYRIEQDIPPEWITGAETYHVAPPAISGSAPRMSFLESLFQGKKGAISFAADSRATLHAMEASDLSTAVHETFHIFRRDLEADDLRIAEEWAGVKEHVWEVEHEEKFARAGERYITDGISPTPELVSVLEKLKNWMLRIYTKIVGSEIDVNITPELRGVFDRLLGGEGRVYQGQGELPGMGVETMPLFSGTAPRVRESLFIPEEPLRKEIQDTFMPEGGKPGEPTLFQAEPPAMGALDATGDMQTTPPIADIAAEGLANYYKPILKALEDQMSSPAAYGPKVTDLEATLDPMTLKALKAWLGEKYGEMSQINLASTMTSQIRRDAALLNYGRRYGFDNVLSMVMPYQFWYTRSALQWGMRAIGRPAWAANYARLRQAQRNVTQVPGFPTRLKDKVKINMPWLPDWAGDGIYIDPLKQVFPFEQFFRPFEQLGRDRSLLNKRAEYVLQDQMENEEVGQTEGQQAIESHQGPLWDKAMTQAKLEFDSEIDNPLEFMNSMISMSMPLQWAYYALIAKEPEKIGPLPLTRMVKAVTSTLGINKGRGVNIEGGIRNALGLPEFDRFQDYRVDRMLSNMAAEGVITTDEANRAMIDRTGPAFLEAEQRVSKLGAASYFGAPLAVDFFPEGEEGQRMLKEEYDRAWQARERGDTQALTAFFDKYPEYEARLQLFKDPATRLKRYMISQVWDAYLALPDLTKKQMREQLGDQFNDAFLNKSTQDYDSITPETLTLWARVMGQKPPEAAPETPEANLDLAPPETVKAYQEYRDTIKQQFPGINPILNVYYTLPQGPSQDAYAAKHPEIEAYNTWHDQYLAQHPDIIPFAISKENRLYNVDPAVQAKVYQYRATVDQQFPNRDALQDQYYALPEGKPRKAFLAQNPELAAFWDFKQSFMAQNPDTIPYVLTPETLAKRVLGEDYIQLPEQQAEPYQPTIQDVIRYMSAPLRRQLMGYTYANQSLGEGALMELNRIWKMNGEPYGDLMKWIEREVAPAMR